METSHKEHQVSEVRKLGRVEMIHHGLNFTNKGNEKFCSIRQK